MSKQEYWYGYLEAGDKSAAVAIDNNLETGNPLTQYVYNLVRGSILEYRRDIVAPKLRELTKDEQNLLEPLKAGLDQARQQFTPRAKGNSTPTPASNRKAAAKNNFELDESDNDTDWDIDDDD